MNIQEMSEADCVALIVAERTGRLACCRDDRPYVVPVHYVCSGSRIFSFSMPGHKLDVMRSNPNVCFEVERIESSDKWRCALVQGVFHEFTFAEDKQDAWKILERHNDWWEVGGQAVRHDDDAGKRQPIFFSLSMDVISGREAL